ncbi:UDP-glucose 4-epimerase GalE [Piscinibacter gummiphilus]|uniref:UDP-glucose 4-epimerase n=1 Tax=Piscinibacter gummiphilus TaxID=946333 RepID=A0ABZ0CX02_9BURK|nr:UDP-glucose 4-epimerase GalE [Piscinibacter gummiphilus]WOB09443.1 UDP-glucose 4-epimerase GalE [Piscinibacter gummiphilus]
MPRILLTGATGYIGSHTWLALLAAGHRVIGVDNFANSSPKVLERLHKLSGQAPVFIKADVCDGVAMRQVFDEHRIDAVVHFAAYKAVGESTEKPLEYYRNNLQGLINVAAAMQVHGVQRLVFSSSATVYGRPQSLPLTEDAPLSSTNPYGTTKLVGEQLLREMEACTPGWSLAYLRYFNPVGAHPSGEIGEDPRGTPNNLMPYVAQVASGARPELQIFGNDYDTPDGTGVRDYIHVMDLAAGHVAALSHLLGGSASFTVNLGTGRGYSVLEVVRAFERASGRPVPFKVVARREGDVAACYADPTLARDLIGWSAQRGLDEMCDDTWRWQRLNPRGFG